ncbi:MAG: hypothetical protein J2P41_10755 [Blastocatellia bacterium]|nr:hypothetical protein [Blastocatellia bacterium]
MMTRKVLLLTLAGLLLVAFYQGVDAQRNHRPGPGPWIYLGDSNVDGVRDHDNIKVGRADGRFKELQLRVQRAPIDFDRVIVHFAGGGNQELPVRHKIAAGGNTEPIDLRGNERVIESVEVWYTKAKWGSRKPRMLLYGR